MCRDNLEVLVSQCVLNIQVEQYRVNKYLNWHHIPKNPKCSLLKLTINKYLSASGQEYSNLDFQKPLLNGSGYKMN